MKKKILIGLLGFIVVVIGVLLLIPAFYSIDDARPQIVKAINQQVSGQVSIEKLQLRLFPSVRFRLEGLKATQAGYKPNEWLAMDSVDVDVALWSILFSPHAELIVHAPKIAVLKGPDGKFNFEEFLAPPHKAGTPVEKTNTLPSDKTAGATADSKTPTPAFDPKSLLDGLPGFVRALIYSARFSLRVDGGSLQYVDSSVLGAKDHVALSDLKFVFKNIGLDTPMQLDSSVGFDVQFGNASLKGPFEGKGTLQIVPVAKGLKLKIDVDESLDKTDLKFSNLFRKSAGRALGVQVAGEVTAVDNAVNVDLTKFEARLDKTRLDGSMKLKNFSAQSMGDLDLKLESKDIDLAGFGVLVPMIADYDLKGKTDFSLSALGSPLDPAVLIGLNLKGIGGTTPNLKRPLRNLSGKISISGTAKNPSILVGPLTMGLGTSDIATNLTAKGMNPMKVEAAVNSKLLNVDEILGLEALKFDAKPAPQTKSKTASAETAPEAAPVTTKNGKPIPLDESLTALQPTIDEAIKNPALDMAELNFKGRIGDLVMLGADFSGIQSGMTYRNRTLKVDNTQLNAYGGKMTANLEIGLRNNFSYSMNSSLNGIEVGQVLQTHMPTWKGVLTGSMTGSANISGVGVGKSDLEKNLKGALKGKVINGFLKLPLVKVVQAIADSMPKLGKAAKSADLEKKVGKSETSGAFKTMDLAARIVGRKVILDTLDVVYDSQKIGGQLRFKATGTVAFDQQIDLLGTIMIDPKILKIEEAQAFVGKSGLAEIPVKIKGTMDSPQPDYAYTAGFIGKKLLADKATGAAADAIRKAVGDKKADALSDILKDPKKAGNLKKLKNLFK